MDAATYNRTRFGIAYTLRDLPTAWSGAAGLLAVDSNDDLELSKAELARVDWKAFTAAVRSFQESRGFSGPSVDGKLGPATLRELDKTFASPAGAVALKIGDLELPVAEQRTVPPPPDQLVDETGSSDRIAVARLWNSYGGAILDNASEANIDPAVALAIFAVESKRAYDPSTGLVIARFEPKVFLRRSGRLVDSTHANQLAEWQAIERAYEINKTAALESASYGLPQLMGFNFGVTDHPDAQSMLLAFQRSAAEQVAGFFGFVAANHLEDEAREKRFVAFARRYNGIGKEQLYATKMKKYFAFAKAMLA